MGGNSGIVIHYVATVQCPIHGERERLFFERPKIGSSSTCPVCLRESPIIKVRPSDAEATRKGK